MLTFIFLLEINFTIINEYPFQTGTKFSIMLNGGLVVFFVHELEAIGNGIQSSPTFSS